jgi:hypothetical protein
MTSPEIAEHRELHRARPVRQVQVDGARGVHDCKGAACKGPSAQRTRRSEQRSNAVR